MQADYDLYIMIPSMTTREKKLSHLLALIEEEVIEHNAAIVLVLDETSVTDDIVVPKTIPVLTIHTTEVGYWNCLNIALLYISGDQPFLYTSDDTLPSKGWLKEALYQWNKYIPGGIGLACLNDGYVRDHSCGHGITTKNYLTVIFGFPWFPAHFQHLYLDTLINDRAKDIGWYVFCEKSEINHQHHLIGNVERDQVSFLTDGRSTGDKNRKDLMDKLWIKWDRKHAIERKDKYNESLH